MMLTLDPDQIRTNIICAEASEILEVLFAYLEDDKHHLNNFLRFYDEYMEAKRYGNNNSKQSRK